MNGIGEFFFGIEEEGNHDQLIGFKVIRMNGIGEFFFVCSSTQIAQFACEFSSTMEGWLLPLG
jgi:hypothetical protein